MQSGTNKAFLVVVVVVKYGFASETLALIKCFKIAAFQKHVT